MKQSNNNDYKIASTLPFLGQTIKNQKKYNKQTSLRKQNN